MVCRMQRRLALRRQLHILRMITHSQSVQKSSAIMDAYVYIYQLKLKLEAMKKEMEDVAAIRNQYLQSEVKVEKGEKGFEVKVRCEKGKDKLVSVLEVFEEMKLSVLHGKVSCSPYFSMEAIVVEKEEVKADVESVTQALVRAINRGG
ncbi:Transcription factor bHLH13 [Linum perenne]